MPVTAKLSRSFYEQFGDDIANELVDWFNAVDETYRTQLKELNDLNWKRFEAGMDARFAAFELKTEQRFAAVDARFGALEVKMADMRADLLKWMVGLWLATILPLGALMVGLFNLMR